MWINYGFYEICKSVCTVFIVLHTLSHIFHIIKDFLLTLRLLSYLLTYQIISIIMWTNGMLHLLTLISACLLCSQSRRDAQNVSNVSHREERFSALLWPTQNICYHMCTRAHTHSIQSRHTHQRTHTQTKWPFIPLIGCSHRKKSAIGKLLAWSHSKTILLQSSLIVQDTAQQALIAGYSYEMSKIWHSWNTSLMTYFINRKCI